MDRRLNWFLIPAMLLAIAGCSNDSSNTSTPASTDQASVPTDPAAKAAYDFLDAVLQGDTQRASSRLTPTALERITATGKQFAPPGLETATFRIGEVRLPTPTQAVVQCFLTDAESGPTPRSEEIGCLLRLVGNEWRVSGIAFSPGPNRPPMILNFENPQQGAVSSQPPMVQSAPTSDRPSPQTAQQIEPAAAYR